MSVSNLHLREQPTSMAERAYQELRDQLIMLTIEPGEPIDDGERAKALGMGRTPVREALKRLEIDRLVISYPRRGTFATGLDLIELEHVCEILTALAPLASRRAAERATTALRAELGKLAEEFAASTPGTVTGLDGTPDPATDAGPAPIMDGLERLQRDTRAHRAIYRVAGNPHLEDVLIRYDNLATRIHRMFLGKLADHTADAVHAAILRAIADGDADRAEALTRRHVLDFESAVRAAI